MGEFRVVLALAALVLFIASSAGWRYFAGPSRDDAAATTYEQSASATETTFCASGCDIAISGAQHLC